MIDKNSTKYDFNPCDYINDGFLITDGSSEEEKAQRVSEMGFYKDDEENEKSRLKFAPNVFAVYLSQAVHFVRNEADDLFFYNHNGFYKEAQKWEIGIICKTLMGQVFDLWNTTYEQLGLDSLRHDLKEVVRKFNATDYLNMTNGVLNVEKMKLLPHSPNFYSTIQLAISYDETATCPRFLTFIDEIANNDQELANLFQEIFGYCLCHNTKAEKAFFLCGGGKNGKTVMANILEQLVGESNVSHTMLANLNDSFGLSAMVDKNVNISSESDIKGKLTTNTFKSIVSGDAMTINRKYKNSLHIALNCKLIFLVNNLPSTQDFSHGYFRRIMLLPFNCTFEETEDKFLTEKLLKELPGILNWALVGLKRLEDNQYRFSTCRVVDDAYAQYKTKQNPLGEFFFDYYESAEKGRLLKSGIYPDYCNWAKDNGLEPVGLGQFWEMLDKKSKEPGSNINLVVKKRKDGRFIVGYQRRKDVPSCNLEFSFQGEEL